MIGQISQERSSADCGVSDISGATAMTTLDRSDSDLYDALRRKRKETYRLFSLLNKDISIFKRKK